MSARPVPGRSDPLDIDDEVARFASVASHDLRNALTTIRGYLDLIAEDEPLTDSGAHLLSRAVEVTIRMHALLDAIGAYGRARRRDLHLGPTDLKRAVTVAWGQIGNDPAAADARLTVEGELPRVRAQLEPLVDVLAHVLDNAVRYGRTDTEPAHVRVTAELGDDVVRLHVDDGGPGLPEGTEHHVFEPFAKTVNSRGQQRAGLGLATAKVLVEAFGGSITATRRREGGTRIVIELRGA